MRFQRLAAGVCMVLASTASFAQTANISKPVTKALNKVQPTDIKAHIAYLADDKLLGRQPGTPGYQMAVDYVTDQFRKMNVMPAGEDGTYLQKVRLRTATTKPDASLELMHNTGAPEVLSNGVDFVLYPNPGKEQVTLEKAPLVFAGYGISAPDMNYDDYANIDAKGKVVVVLRGTPDGFPSTVASYSMDMQTILNNAAKHGAVGVLVGSTNPKGQVPDFSRGMSSVMGADGKVAASRSYHDDIKLLGMVNYSTLQKLLTGAGLNVEQAAASIKSGSPASAPLPFSVSGSYASSYKDIESYNVVGKIEGSDPKLKNEYVVHSAHLDHVGVGKAIDGDSIYNGAHDNASGVASLLEIANVYSRLNKKPKRSVLIVMVTAEEMGLLGSAYFAKYPTVPRSQIVADINTDMPTLIAPLLAVVPLGAAHSSLEDEVKQASSYLGLDVEEDPEPEQNRFVRSDQYSFVTQGVPALHIKYGNKTADGKNNLDEQVKVWRAKYYHKPQDNFEGGVFDFDAAKKYVQLNFLIGYLVAQDQERPNWKEGDFFGTRFGKLQ